MAGYQASERERWASIAAVVLVHAVLAAALLWGLAPRFTTVRDRVLTTFAVLPPAPPPPVVPDPAPADAPALQGEAAPSALRATPSPVAAPTPIVPPPTLPAPPIAAEGAAVAAGAAPTPGPGTGAGGVGAGLGRGAAGSGTGGSSGATLIRGGIVDRDYPRDARRARLGGVVTVRFTVEPDGRVDGCRVTQSSGVASLDLTTCRLIEQRYRYTPARDAAGRAVAEPRGWRQTWWLDGMPLPGP